MEQSRIDSSRITVLDGRRHADKTAGHEQTEGKGDELSSCRQKKVDLGGQEHSPTSPAGTRTRDLSITSLAL